MAFWQRSRKLDVVLATHHPRVSAALNEASAHLEQVKLARHEALSYAGTFQALQGAQLAIVDLSVLTGEEREREQLSAALRSAHLVVVDGQEFVSAPVRILERAVATAGLGSMLPPRTVAFSGWSGGVGKTTLALATASAFHQATGLPAAVIELAPGPSAIAALTNVAGHDLYEVITQAGVYPVWEGVTLSLMNWSTARLLQATLIVEHWQALARAHTFVAYDAPAWHPLFKQAPVEQLVEQLYILADQRADAQVAAVALVQQLQDRLEKPVQIGLNRAGLVGSLALPEKPAFKLRAKRRPLTVGNAVLRAIYPGWRG